MADFDASTWLRSNIMGATLLNENALVAISNFTVMWNLFEGLIIYRLRNNLFHGLKSFHLLNDQAENLNRAAAGLAAFMKMHNGEWIVKEETQCNH